MPTLKRLVLPALEALPACLGRTGSSRAPACPGSPACPGDRGAMGAGWVMEVGDLLALESRLCKKLTCPGGNEAVEVRW